jgi:hypothetical protein
MGQRKQAKANPKIGDDGLQLFFTFYDQMTVVSLKFRLLLLPLPISIIFTQRQFFYVNQQGKQKATAAAASKSLHCHFQLTQGLEGAIHH